VGGTAASGHEGNIESSHGAARTRVLLSLAAGVVAFGLAKLFTTWQVAALVGWIVAATVFIVWIYLSVGGMDGEATVRHAAIEDASRPTADLILILASVTSLVGVGLSLLEASSRPGFGEGDHHGGGLDDRHPLLGDRPHVRYHDRLADDPPNDAAPRVHVVPVRDRRGGDDDQRDREPAQPVDGPRYIGLTSWK
jgi:hypothetical protein